MKRLRGPRRAWAFSVVLAISIVALVIAGHIIADLLAQFEAWLNG